MILITISECEPKRPIPVLMIHGTLDPLFPWYGGVWHGIPKVLETWLKVHQCDANTESEDEVALGNMQISRNKPFSYKSKWRKYSLGIVESKWNNCSVQLVKIIGGSHSWPPQRMSPEAYIWNFFKNSGLVN